MLSGRWNCWRMLKIGVPVGMDKHQRRKKKGGKRDQATRTPRFTCFGGEVSSYIYGRSRVSTRITTPRYNTKREFDPRDLTAQVDPRARAHDGKSSSRKVKVHFLNRSMAFWTWKSSCSKSCLTRNSSPFFFFGYFPGSNFCSFTHCC